MNNEDYDKQFTLSMLRDLKYILKYMNDKKAPLYRKKLKKIIKGVVEDDPKYIPEEDSDE